MISVHGIDWVNLPKESSKCIFEERLNYQTFLLFKILYIESLGYLNSSEYEYMEDSSIKLNKPKTNVLEILDYGI